MTIEKPIPAIAYQVTILHNLRPIITMDWTRDLDAVCEAMDQINGHKENRLYVSALESAKIILTYNDHILLTGKFSVDAFRLLSQKTDLRARVQVGAASDEALKLSGV